MTPTPEALLQLAIEDARYLRESHDFDALTSPERILTLTTQLVDLPKEEFDYWVGIFKHIYRLPTMNLSKGRILSQPSL